MPRKRIPTNLPGPYHVSSRCINKEWFSIPMDLVWDIFSDRLYLVKHAFNLEIHAFVLMNNHYHLLVSAPDGNLAEALTYLLREVSICLNVYGNRINRTFAGRYFRCLFETQHHYVNCHKYIYQNPVRAGIVQRVEDYKYSTLPAKLGKQHSIIPFSNDIVLFDGCFLKQLEWLNTRISDENADAFKKGLKRTIFKLRKDLNTNREHYLESGLI